MDIKIESKVSDNYQVTIPKTIRDLLKVNKQDTIIFNVTNKCEIIIKKKE